MASGNGGLDHGRDVGRSDDVRADRHHESVESSPRARVQFRPERPALGTAEAGKGSMTAPPALALTQSRALDVRRTRVMKLQRAPPLRHSGAGSMANALVIRKTQLPKLKKDLSAAQYVRMSTDHQRYSIQNQAAAIATYAASRKRQVDDFAAES